MGLLSFENRINFDIEQMVFEAPIIASPDAVFFWAPVVTILVSNWLLGIWVQCFGKRDNSWIDVMWSLSFMIPNFIVLIIRSQKELDIHKKTTGTKKCVKTGRREALVATTPRPLALFTLCKASSQLLMVGQFTTSIFTQRVQIKASWSLTTLVSSCGWWASSLRYSPIDNLLII